MSITDQAILSEIQYSVLELDVPDGGATWPSGLWTQVEVLGYLNQRQMRFIKETDVFVAQDRIPVTAGTTRVNLVDQLSLPLDWIDTIELSWQYTAGADQVTIWPVEHASQREVDLYTPLWLTSPARPQFYMDTETPLLVHTIAPPPDLDGLLYIEYLGLSAVLDGSGEIFTVPDEFVPAIKWGALADMLSKVGRGQNLGKAQYCESRYQEGVTAALTILRGW